MVAWACSARPAGLAMGEPTFVTGMSVGAAGRERDAVECFYRIMLSDNTAITPAFFYLSCPQGQDTGPGGSVQSYGFLVQSTFRF